KVARRRLRSYSSRSRSKAPVVMARDGRPASDGKSTLAAGAPGGSVGAAQDWQGFGTLLVGMSFAVGAPRRVSEGPLDPPSRHDRRSQALLGQGDDRHQVDVRRGEGVELDPRRQVDDVAATYDAIH